MFVGLRSFARAIGTYFTKDTDCNRAAGPQIPLKKAVRIRESNINVNTMAYREFAHQ